MTENYKLGWILWLLVSLVVLISLPGLMSANYLPKTFWGAVTIGIGFVVLPPRYPGRFSITPLGIIWLAYLAWVLLSALWALSPRVTFERWLALLLPTFAYILAKRIRFWESDRFWLGFCILAGLVALIGILQYFFPALPLVNFFPGTAIPRATLGHRNYAGMYFMLVLPFLGWSFFHLRGKKSVAALAGFFLAVLFVLIARNRGAWLGIIFGLIFILAANFHRIRCFGIFKIRKDVLRLRLGSSTENAKKTDRKKFLLLIIISCFSVFILLVFKTQAPFGGRKADILKTSINLLEGKSRIGYWKGCLGITNPAVGCGLGNFPIVITPTLKSGQVETLNYEVHNDYLQAYLDLGSPGLLIFVSIFGYLLYLAWIGRNQGIILAAGAAVTGLIVMQFTTFTSEKVSSQIWLAGMVAIINSQGCVRLVISKRTPRWVVLSGNYLAILWLLIFAAIVGYTIRGDRAFRKVGKIVFHTLEYERLIKNPKEISAREVAGLQSQLPFIRADALNRLHWLADRILPTMFFDANMKHITCFQFADYAMALKDYDDAAVFARQAFLIHPTDRVNLKRLCEIALNQEQYNQAIYLLNKGIETFGYNPYQPFFCDKLCVLYDDMKLPERADYISEKMSQNKVSRPENPFPKDRSNRVPVDVVFDWDDCNAAETYELYLWKTGEQAPEDPTITGVSKSEVRFQNPLEYGTIYFWRVVSIGRYIEESSNLWFFRTVKKSE